jgi:DNA-binding NarL/FixJ family response regulator
LTAILVVDDGETDRELVVTVLRYAGYTTAEAPSGERGLALARSQPPDLIIADILMPTMDGYEFVRELRADPRTASLRVIFYTSTYVIDEAQRLADAVGVSHVLVKPSEPETILSVVAQALSAPLPEAVPLPSEHFHHEHLRVVNAKLLQKVEELRRAVIPERMHQRPEPAPDPRLGPAGIRPDRVLSRRELEVLAALAEGATNAEIAQRLTIAETTVQSHLRQIFRKLAVRNRTEATARFLRREP